jgi:hypothetical protein
MRDSSNDKNKELNFKGDEVGQFEEEHCLLKGEPDNFSEIEEEMPK